MYPCGNDPILYTIATSGTWTRSIDDVLSVLMVYADDSGKLMLHHPSLFEIKSHLSSRSYEYRSIAVIKRGFYMGSRSDVTPLLGDDRFIKIGRNKFIQMDGLLVHIKNPFDFTIKACMYVRIYYEKLSGMSEQESLKIPYLVELLDCLVEVSTGGTLCWVKMFEIDVDFIGRGHHIP